MEFQIVRNEIKRVVGQIWELTLQLPIHECTTQDSLPTKSDGSGKAQIEISGAWNGLLEVEASQEMMQTIARRMFDIGQQSSPNQEQVIDCLKEISNVIGGNLKTVLPEPCDLSIPKMLFDSQSHPERQRSKTSPLLELVFESDNEELVTRIFKRAEC